MIKMQKKHQAIIVAKKFGGVLVFFVAALLVLQIIFAQTTYSPSNLFTSATGDVEDAQE